MSVKPLPSDLGEVIDKAKLSETFKVLALHIPAKFCNPFIKSLSKENMLMLDVKTVQNDEKDPSKRYILFNRATTSFPEEATKIVKELGLNESEVLSSFEVTFGYDQMTTDEVLKKLLPPGLDLVTGFEAIGHIAHMNLREDCLPYKYIIGKVILDKNKPLRTVVNKIDEIHTVFRTFPMELLAGEMDMNAEVKESNCRFRFNFAEVYWNSKLSNEHAALVDLFQPDEVIADMFAGVGPFAIPAAKKGCLVYANDLNPRSYHYLLENAKSNACFSKIKAFNLDGREFIQKLVKDGIVFDHAVMNLPASATSFLDIFRGLFPADWPRLPTVHCYGFSKAEDPKADILAEAEKFYGQRIENATVTIVRSVSPKKWMLRVSFKVQPARNEGLSELEGPTKKARLDH